MYKRPVIPAPDEYTASTWEAEERAQNERDDLAWGLTGSYVKSVTKPSEKEPWELELERDFDELERESYERETR